MGELIAMHGSSDAVSLLVKGLLLGMSFGAAIYGEERGGKAAAATGLIRETAKALSPLRAGADAAGAEASLAPEHLCALGET